MSAEIPEIIEIRDSAGKLCGTYHCRDPFKSFFRGLYTPNGINVVACPPPDHPHHKGLQFGLTCKDVNFWEESLDAEPSNCRPPIGVQETTSLLIYPPGGPNGFEQTIRWRHDQTITFEEKRIVTVKEQQNPKAYVWSWHTTLIAQRDVTIISSVWSNCGLGVGYCGLGLRLARDAFQGGQVVPPGTGTGSTPANVAYVGQNLGKGKGVEVVFMQPPGQHNALFVSYYGGDPDFAFMALGPANLPPPVTLQKNGSLDCQYTVSVADFPLM